MGGKGPKRTPALAAAFADEYNVPFSSLAESDAAFRRVEAACRAADRDIPVFSVAQTVACGRDEAEAERRAEAIGGPPPLYGTPDQVAEQIRQFAAIGVSRVFLQILDLSDLDHLDVLASEVARR